MIKKILIADDHSAIRIGVRHICVNEFPGVIIEEATNYAEVFQKLNSDNWDILILDIDLPGRSGLDILHELLSEREYQTMLLIASGKTVTEIAEVLCLSKATISTYRARVLEKMKMKNNAELTTYTISQKLV